MPCIYALEFPNGKVYIGQTVNAAEERFKGHIKGLKKLSENNKLQNAWMKHGQPTLRTLLQCAKKELNFYEMRAIAVYDSMRHGYNSTTGGDSNNELAPEVKAAISATVKKQMQDPGRLKQMSDAGKQTWIDKPHPCIGTTRSEKANLAHSELMKAKYADGWAPNAGKKRSEESRKRISEAHLGITQPASARIKLKETTKNTWATYTPEQRAQRCLNMKLARQQKKVG